MIYPPKKLVNVVAEYKIFQGHTAHANVRPRNWPRVMLMYRGRSILLSAPKGILFAAMSVPNTSKAQKVAQTKMAKRTLERGYLSMMAVRRSHGFQSSSPQLLLIADVAKIPSVALSVMLIGLASSCGQMDAYLLLEYRLKSGALVMRLALEARQ